MFTDETGMTAAQIAFEAALDEQSRYERETEEWLDGGQYEPEPLDPRDCEHADGSNTTEVAGFDCDNCEHTVVGPMRRIYGRYNIVWYIFHGDN